MSDRARSALWFGLRFVPLFALFVWLYPKILPAYESLVIGTSNRFLAVGSPRLELESHPDGHVVSRVIRPGGRVEPLPDLSGYQPLAVFAQLPLVAALLLATPMSASRLLGRSLLGLLLVFGTHVLAATVLFHAWLRSQVVPHSPLYDWLGLIAMTSGQIGAFVVWGLLTWGFWLSLGQPVSRRVPRRA